MGITIRSTNNIPGITKQLKKLGKTEIRVGVLGGDSEMQMIAAVHEYGINIKVTDKMRGWFGANGYPLNKETKEIIIPERSFIRTGFDESVKDLENKIDGLLPSVLDLSINVDAFAEMIGLELEGKIKKKLRDLKEPNNTQMTVERKGSSNPLVDSGKLLDSITYEVK